MAEKTLNAAKAASLRIDSRIIRDVGNGFIEAAAKNPDAWDAALAFVNYRSFLNAESFNLPTRPDAIQETKYELPPGKFVVGPFRTAQVVVPSEAPEIPQFRTLDAPDLNRGVSVGPSFLFIEGGTLVIDDLYLKRIIFRDLHVIFRGGRVVLQNVLFINCIFDIAQAPQGQTLASALVSGPITTFSSYRA